MKKIARLATQLVDEISTVCERQREPTIVTNVAVTTKRAM